MNGSPFSPESLDPDRLRTHAVLDEYQSFGRTEDVVAHVEYQRDPVGWMRDKLGVDERTLVWDRNEGYESHEWDGDSNPLALVCNELAEWRDVGCESGTGTGKTFLGACVVLWFLATYEDSIVVTVAPKLNQLTKHLWKEIGTLWPRFQRHFPQAELLASGVIRMKPAVEDREIWGATAFGTGVGAEEQSATKAQGWHAEHMLVLLEETPGIHPAIMVAFENTCSSPHNLRLAFGNPDHEWDELHQFCLSPNVTHVRVSALDHPNVVMDDPMVVPGAVSVSAIERRKDLYAHIPAMYESRVRGISPRQATGVTLAFIDSDHLETFDPTAMREQKWPLFAGIDFGAWRFSFILAAADRAKRLHIIDEHFSQQEVLSVRAKAIAAILDKYDASPATPIWGDSANPQDILEINQAFRSMGSRYRVRAVSKTSTENKPYRRACVERLQDLLGKRALLFSRDLGKGMSWFKGASVASQGRRVRGSRLLWEIRQWRYPEKRDGKAQTQDPDDDTADGADAIAGLRYLVMSWWKGARYEAPADKSSRNRDTGLDELLDRIAKQQQGIQRYPF